MTVLVALLLLQQTLSQQGAEAMRKGRFEEAERIFRQLIKEHPNEPRLRMNLGLALFSGAKYTEAVAELDRFTRAFPQPGPAHLMLGAAHLKLRKPCAAIAPLEAARRWRENEQVLVELGDAYFGCGRFADAAKTFESMGTTPKALQGAGLSYARLGRPDLAQAAFDKLASLPPSPQLHELVAEVHTLQSRHELAVTELQAAVKLAPSDSRLRRLLARAHWRAAQYDEAAALYAELAPKWQHDAEFNYERGDTLVRTEGIEAGLPLLEKAVKSAPNLMAARGALGRALAQAGRAAESIEHLEAGSRQDATLLLPLSRAYRATGRAEDAARTEAEYKKRVANQASAP
jgi:tetratricopeptide (TPR) repeat protein